MKSGTSDYSSAQTYDGYVSADGVVWHHVGNQTSKALAACDEVGIYYRKPKSVAGDPVMDAAVDCFRRIV